MALAILERCMLVKRYRLRHTPLLPQLVNVTRRALMHDGFSRCMTSRRLNFTQNSGSR